MATLAEQLASVQAAIAAIEGGAQSYSLNNRTYVFGDLKTLYERERHLLARIAHETSQGRTIAEF
ncbi:MAG: hypothetical protein ACYTEQ_05650 [Planctomycetota bacterium]|jgi:hypothetical protein